MSISLAEYHAMQAETMSEKQFQDVVIAAAERRGFLVYHTHDSRRSQAGYPDLHLVHTTRRRSLFRELKTMKGKTSKAQNIWLAALTNAGHDAGVWRPIHWFDKTIERELDQETTR
ncbi:VRR-NUC domain-containing protein [Glaciihabitans sp. dw_435]|uniref:VRR-NUC domain-containing protein n=1 Tax=Glaciihabitans sp. dw_435 TaxID=2720081 RepID=UPI001BD3AA07|nr:VRR-NUC domain-containing protein [Glaciihabitans sp. dw_435]